MTEILKRVVRSPITFALLTAVWCIVIFGFSAENAEQSSSTSAEVIVDICEITVNGYEDLEPAQQQEIVSGMQFEVRKLAHFSLYLVLGILSLMTVRRLRKPAFAVRFPPLTAIIFCALYAASDEFHQLFSEGRSGQITDVILDTSGAAVGCALALLAAFVFRKVKTRKAT